MKRLYYFLLSGLVCFPVFGQSAGNMSQYMYAEDDSRMTCSRYIDNGDYVGLALHEQQLMQSGNEMEDWLVQAYMGLLKNNPGKTVKYTEMLLDKYQDDMGGGITSVLRLKARAEEYLGNYAAAATLYRICTNYSPGLCGSYERCMALSWLDNNDVLIRKGKMKLKIKPDEDGSLHVEMKTGHVRSRARMSFAEPHSVISHTEAEALGMKILTVEHESGELRTVAVAGQIAIDDMIVHGVLFDVVEDDSGIVIGNNVLSRIPYITLSKSAVTFSIDRPEMKKGYEGTPLLLVGGVMCIVGDDGEVLSVGRPLNGAVQTSAQSLVPRGRDVTIGMSDMMMYTY